MNDMHRRSLAPISKTLMCMPCNAAGIGKFRSAKAERLLPYPCEKEFTTTIKKPHRLFIGKATVHSSGVSPAKRDAPYSPSPISAYGICRGGMMRILTIFQISIVKTRHSLSSVIRPVECKRNQLRSVIKQEFIPNIIH